jgi:hypothetical protein
MNINKIKKSYSSPFQPDDIISPSTNKYNDVASNCKCPHSLSPTTVLPRRTNTKEMMNERIWKKFYRLLKNI